MEDILKNPSIIDKEYPLIKDTPNNHITYTANQNRSRKLVLVNALDEISKLEDTAKEYNITADTNINHVLIRSENPQVIKDFIQLAVKVLKQDNIKNKLIVMLQFQKGKCEDFIRQNQMDSLKFLYTFFDALGFNKSYLHSYNVTKNKFGFSGLNYSLSNDDTDNTISFADSFSEDFLKTLSTRDLCFYNAFWCNRFAKECSQLYSAFSAINSLDLWKSILKGKNEFFISDQALTACIQKSNFLSGLMRDTFNIHQSNVSTAEVREGVKFSTPLSKDYTSYYMKLNNMIKDDYTKYFYNESLKNNDFIEDIAFATPFINLEMFAYRKKVTSIEPLIKNMMDNNHFKNWGIIRKELQNGTYVDSIDTNKPKILLAFDIEGFNMPFRFHVSKDSVMDLARLSNLNYIIPEYQGAEDFIVNNEVIPSNIIMPILKHHKKIIMDNSKIEGPNQNLWEHFYFLMNGKFPKHLTQTIKKNRKETVATRLPIQYTDLKTGKRYIKNDKNKFIEVDESNVR